MMNTQQRCVSHVGAHLAVLAVVALRRMHTMFACMQEQALARYLISSRGPVGMTRMAIGGRSASAPSIYGSAVC